jgi:hypothetical protein
MTQYPLYRRIGGQLGWSARVQEISPYRDSIPGTSRPQSVAILSELSLPVFLRQPEPSSVKGSCIGPISIHLKELQEDKNYFRITDPLWKQNSVPASYTPVQCPYSPIVTNGNMSFFVSTGLPSLSHQVFCFPMPSAPVCQPRIIGLAFQRVHQSKQNASCISLHKHF